MKYESFVISTKVNIKAIKIIAADSKGKLSRSFGRTMTLNRQ